MPILTCIQEGEINMVYAFDTRNGYAGQADGGHIDDGGILTVTVDQATPGLRAEYIAISNKNDAACVAWITVKQFDDTYGGAWTGDIGSECEQASHYSEESAGKLKNDDGSDSDTDYNSRCTWLDGDHTNDIAISALKFDVGAYAADKVEATLANGACDATIYRPDNGPISGKTSVRFLST